MPILAGNKPSFPISPDNTANFLLSDPFHAESEYIRQAPKSNGTHWIDNRIAPHKAAFVDSATAAQISHGRLRQDARRIAHSLRYRLNLHPAPADSQISAKSLLSPIVLLHLPNCIQFPVIELGVWAAGLTVTSANPALKPAEIAYIIELSRPALIITSAGKDGLGVIQEAIQQVSDTQLQKSLSLDRVFTVNTSAGDYGTNEAGLVASTSQSQGARDWKWLLGKESFQLEPYKGNESERRAAIIIWSSGTSGKSKGVVLSHRALVSNLQMTWYNTLVLGNNENFLAFVPFFHIFGLMNVMMMSIAIGATTVCMSKFEPKPFLSHIETYGITHLHMAPPIAVFLAKSPLAEGIDFSSVTGATSGGAPMGVPVIEAVYKRVKVLVKLSYGISETAGGISSIKASTFEEYLPFIGNTGVPYEGTEIKILSTDGANKELNIGETGEFLVRSPSLMSEYLGNASATAEALDDDGWYHTGDIGFVDKHQQLYITDRLKEVIKVKGFQVAPAELEAYLAGHALVADAGVTAIYSDDDATEYPVAYIVPRDTKICETSRALVKACPEGIALANVLKAYIEDKTVNYKWLRGGIVLVDVIPKSSAGKILRKDFKMSDGHHVVLYEAKKRSSKL